MPSCCQLRTALVRTFGSFGTLVGASPSRSPLREEPQCHLPLPEEELERGLVDLRGQPKVASKFDPTRFPERRADGEEKAREQERTRTGDQPLQGNSLQVAIPQTAGSTWMVSSSRPPIAPLRTLLTRAVTFSMLA